ncbi:hypothetical protein CEU41_24245 [Salmonella enterica subsp. enterica serovar Oranienburg]|nr:hypothetical protein [Salmonella enterica subsp. enterica serovar Oranienburg]EBH8545066.1 hypothetical protein [Salmonella enterica subsp. enterica serovar Oranienburg]
MSCRSSLHVPCRGENTRSKCPFKFDHNIKHLFTPKLKYHTRNCCSFLLPKPQNLASQRLKQVVFWSI